MISFVNNLQGTPQWRYGLVNCEKRNQIDVVTPNSAVQTYWDVVCAKVHPVASEYKIAATDPNDEKDKRMMKLKQRYFHYHYYNFAWINHRWHRYCVFIFLISRSCDIFSWNIPTRMKMCWCYALSLTSICRNSLITICPCSTESLQICSLGWNDLRRIMRF